MKVKLDGVCELSGKQEGDAYLIILTADNEGASPQKLSWDVQLPLPLHSAGRIVGEKTLYPHDSGSTEILMSKRLTQPVGNRVRNAMSDPITATVTAGSKTETIKTTWSGLFQK
jgi:hypothetical protein